MGLRIGTNVGALSALRNLRIVTQQEQRTNERLATGQRINRGSDNPSGMILLEQFRSELEAIRQASANTQNAANLVNTADAALEEISNRIVELRGTVVSAMNSGIVGPDGQRALQRAVDSSLSAIDRIASTTRFGGQALLNGSLGFNVTGASSQLSRIDVQGGNFPGGLPYSAEVRVTAAATRATATGTLAAGGQATAATIRIQGPSGQRDIVIAAGSSQQQVIDAINGETANTGVEATATGEIRTQQFGSNVNLNIQNVTGTLSGVTTGFYRGTDIVAQVNGQASTGTGNTLRTNAPFQSEITVEAGATGTFGFTIEGGGARFQLGPVSGGADDFNIGVNHAGTGVIGASSGVGTLRDLATGGTGSLARDPGRALQILDSASREVSSLRGRLGAAVQQVFEPNSRALDVAFENLSASKSSLGDADFAEEIAQSVRNRLIRDSSLQVLKKVSLNAGSVLKLLG